MNDRRTQMSKTENAEWDYVELRFRRIANGFLLGSAVGGGYNRKHADETYFSTMEEAVAWASALALDDEALNKLAAAGDEPDF
jgi:hypothetical protein